MIIYKSDQFQNTRLWPFGKCQKLFLKHSCTQTTRILITTSVSQNPIRYEFWKMMSSTPIQIKWINNRWAIIWSSHAAWHYTRPSALPISLYCSLRFVSLSRFSIFFQYFLSHHSFVCHRSFQMYCLQSSVLSLCLTHCSFHSFPFRTVHLIRLTGVRLLQKGWKSYNYSSTNTVFYKKKRHLNKGS